MGAQPAQEDGQNNSHFSRADAARQFFALLANEPNADWDRQNQRNDNFGEVESNKCFDCVPDIGEVVDNQTGQVVEPAQPLGTDGFAKVPIVFIV